MVLIWHGVWTLSDIATTGKVVDILEFRGFCCRLFIFLASEERVPKQIQQVSIVGKNTLASNI